MNCKQGDNALVVYAFKHDAHYDELLGKPIKCMNVQTVVYLGYEQLGPFTISRYRSAPMWPLPEPHTCKCGCILDYVPDEMLQPLPEVDDDAQTHEDKTKELDTVI